MQSNSERFFYIQCHLNFRLPIKTLHHLTINIYIYFTHSSPIIDITQKNKRIFLSDDTFLSIWIYHTNFWRNDIISHDTNRNRCFPRHVHCVYCSQSEILGSSVGSWEDNISLVRSRFIP